MEGRENSAYDEEAPPLPAEGPPIKTDVNKELKETNGAISQTNGKKAQIELEMQKEEESGEKWREILAQVRKVCTTKRVVNTLIVLYLIGALLHWFVFKTENQWNICQDEGLVLILVFFYLCYVLSVFSPYLSKGVSFTVVPLHNAARKLLGPWITKIAIYGLQIAALTAYLIWDIWGDFARWRSMIGVFKNLFVLWAFCGNKRKIKWEVPIRSLLLQFYICLVMLRIPFVNDFVTCLTTKFTTFLNFSKEGGGMVFGQQLTDTVFAFTIMPVIMFLSFVVAILNHLNILPRFISALGRALLRVLGTDSEVEAFNSAASVFLGQTESPILILRYLDKLTRSELFTIMVSGLSTIAGAVMAAYIQFGFSAVHMITASIMSAIGAIGACKMFMPDTEPTQTGTMVIEEPDEKKKATIFDITTNSASTAFDIIKSIISCLIIWLSAIPFVNSIIESLFYLLFGIQGITFEYLLGWIFTPFAYLMGAEWVDAQKVGRLVGIKIIVNEFVAYTELKKLQGIISERSTTVATYALCGFSNFGAMATLVSTLKVMAPGRIKDITKNAYWSLLVANIVCDMTACIAGALTAQ